MKAKMLRQLLLLLLLGITTTGHEYYSSTEEMANLVALDKKLMSTFLTSIGERLGSSAMRNLEAVDPGGHADPGDPIMAYKLISRMRRKWNIMHTYSLQNPSDGDGLLEYLGMINASLPAQLEVDGVAMGLLRLQEIYRLEPQSIMGHDPAGLSPDEAHHVASVASRHEKFYLALQWLREAHRLLMAGQEPLLRSIETLRQDLQWDLRHAARGLRPVPQRILDLLDKDPVDMEEVMVQLGEETFPPSTNYETLCREGYRMTPRRQRALFCRYSTAGGNPRLMYAPVKEEDEWDHPRIVRYHDFLSEQEMDMIKSIARPELSRSQVTQYQGTEYIDDFRVSKGAWFVDDHYPLLTRITQRMDDVTSLNMRTSEDLQVANYGIGGHFGAHYDTVVVDEYGGRIATILLYLSDVEVGGATVFPEVGAALQPIKGSAVLWFNLLQNGEVDDLTLHSGCPVFRGNKWVANKWVHERGQEFRRRCSLNPWE